MPTPTLAVLGSISWSRREPWALAARGVDVWVFSGRDWFLQNPDAANVARERHTVGFEPVVVRDFGAALDTAAKIVGVSQDHALVARCEAELAAELGDGASVARSQRYYLDITHALANKGAALRAIAAHLAIPLDEIAVIGDEANVLAMFGPSDGLAIAMGNAEPAVQRAADHVTGANNDGGFAEAVDRYILARRPDLEHRSLRDDPVFEAEMVVVPDPVALAARAAAWLLDAARAAQGRFAVSLSGGSTPRALYALLAQPPYLASFPWARTHWFWGDERFVPHDDPESNYRMVRETLLSKAPIPAANVHAIPTEGLGADAAAGLRGGAFYGADALDPARPLFDVTLLGLGPDGHTASLFPGQPVLDERIRWVAADLGPGGKSRITLTHAGKQPAHRLPDRGRGKAGDSRPAARRRRRPAIRPPAA